MALDKVIFQGKNNIDRGLNSKLPTAAYKKQIQGFFSLLCTQQHASGVDCGDPSAQKLVTVVLGSALSVAGYVEAPRALQRSTLYCQVFECQRNQKISHYCAVESPRHDVWEYRDICG